ncbi:hypothetical protein J31TS4_02010 [Paenibacillus sp. J31TS4]|uniref:putative RNA methyltransferase n=1 Tax=Paenibacillus sp. J31TS4 TaxID=2807195 RepID=UPI001B29A3DF|nr:methyltransferase domain-containing protein [Paenibacillus sp. J31TS4]GIP36921.1 hypothetical protein J31TS4_02010 [Paenibacillus sp. J31TS4]
MTIQEQAGLLAEEASLFACPVCGEAMEMTGSSLRCAKGHSYDVAKPGYVNLLRNPPSTRYDKSLFVSRRKLMEDGLFDSLLDRLAERIQANEAPQESSGSAPRLLDAGCGEGSPLVRLQERLAGRAGLELLGVGVDLAKEGIRLAARSSSRTVWCVGDLANSPFRDGSFRYILSLLSPSNYAEFRRLLEADGLVLKVVPQADYLQELRARLYGDSLRPEEEARQAADWFRQHFQLADEETVRYSFPVREETWSELLAMTPLAWKATAEQLAEVRQSPPAEVTVSMRILAGRRPG